MNSENRRRQFAPGMTIADRFELLRPLGNVLYTMPPLRTSPASLDRIASAIKEAVDRVKP